MATGSAVFTVQLTQTSTQTVTVNFATVDGTATSPLYYTPQSGTLTFNPGDVAKAITVEIQKPVLGDPATNFSVRLSNGTHCTFQASGSPASVAGVATATIPAGPAAIASVGPLIQDGLIVNAYQDQPGRGDYFSSASGTSEGQSIMILGCYVAYEALLTGSPTGVETTAATWYKNLAQKLLDGLGDGTSASPMLRQSVPSDPTIITLLHWLFAARGSIPLQNYQLYYTATAISGHVTITPGSGTISTPNPDGSGTIVTTTISDSQSADIFRVYKVYPKNNPLLYSSPYSPVIGGGAIPVLSANWTIDGSGNCVITISGLTNGNQYNIAYAYNNSKINGVADILAKGSAYEAYPVWVRIPTGYASCAPDTFRWFDQAMDKAILYDARSGNSTKWTNLKNALKRTSVVGQNITDLREVFKPLKSPVNPGLPVFSTSGMFSYSSRPGATTPTISEQGSPTFYSPNWSGYNFWTRDNTTGDIVGTISAATDPGSVQAQLGRGINDSWRIQTTYQDPDQYLYVNLCCSVKPAGAEVFEIFVSHTAAYDPNTRWFANIGAYSSFVAVPGTPANSTIEFLIPITDLKNKLGSNTALPAGTTLLNFGINSEIMASHTIRLRAMRLVSGPSTAAILANVPKYVKGSQMPFFPGAMPFDISADLINQQFVGYNGNPFHGYQQPDFWLSCSSDATTVYPSLTSDDLPTVDSSGALQHPISTTNANATTKPSHLLLMEQQIRFLLAAQDKYEVDFPSHRGPFAHTFVLNTPARDNIGDPTPFTWVYLNDDPNTRWVGYQCRPIVALARGAYLVKQFNPSNGQDVYNLSIQIATDWLNWLNGYWPDLTGENFVDPTTHQTLLLKGMPTDFPGPEGTNPEGVSGGLPYRTYDEPHAPALIIRACMYMKLCNVNSGTNSLCDALMTRCWTYMNTLYRTTGDMAGTWCPLPAQHSWYGFWHGEIITTIGLLLTEGLTTIPSSMTTADLRQKLVYSQSWLKTYGVQPKLN